jgi:type IV secretory pathway protease TraF
LNVVVAIAPAVTADINGAVKASAALSSEAPIVEVRIGVEAPVSGDRVVVVEAEDRTKYIERQDRTYLVPDD